MGEIGHVAISGRQVGLQDGSWQEVKCGIIYQLADRVEISAGVSITNIVSTIRRPMSALQPISPDFSDQH